MLLQVTMDVANHHKSVYFVAICGLIAQAGLAVYVYSLIPCPIAVSQPACTSEAGTSTRLQQREFLHFFGFWDMWISRI